MSFTCYFISQGHFAKHMHTISQITLRKKERNQYHRDLKDEVFFNCMVFYFLLYIQ